MKRTLYITVLFIASGFLGFLCQILYGKYFGAGLDMDVYFSLLSIPSLITGVAPIIFVSVFLPNFSEYNEHDLCDYIGSVKKYVSLFSLMFSISGGVLTYLNLENIIKSSNEDILYLSICLCVCFWINTYFAILNGYLACIHNYYKHFFVVAATPLLTYLFIILSIILFERSLGVKTIAIGMVIASIVQYVVYKYYDNRILKVHKKINVNIKSLCGKIVLISFSLMPFTAFSAISYYWGSFLSPGAVSYLGYSHSFSGFLSVAASMGVATVSFPELAKLLNTDNRVQIEKTLCSFNNSLKVVMFLTIIISVFVIIFIDPFLRFLLLRGKFDIDAVSGLAKVLPYYFLSGICLSALNLIRNVYYSMKQLFSFAIVSIGVTILFLSLAIIINENISYVGIGIVEFLCLLVFLVLSFILLNVKNNHFTAVSFYLDISKFLFVSILVGVAVKVFFNNILYSQNLFFSLLISGLLYISLSVLLLAKCFNIAEVKMIVDLLNSRLRR